MASQEIDLEKNQITVDTTIVSPSKSPLSPLQTYQLIVGDINAPEDPNDENIYQSVLHQGRKAKFWFFFSGAVFYLMIALQIFFCLSIAVGAQLNLTRDTISILAAVNTGVAAVIGVLKGLGLPEKKGLERYQLQKIAQKIRLTTKKLKAGFEVDVTTEIEDVRNTYEKAEDEAMISTKDIGAAAVEGAKAAKK